jgi:hypothetical protein
MAAWTLPNRIADWCQILTTALDRRSRKYFLTIVLGMLLGSGRRTVSCWLQAAGGPCSFLRSSAGEPIYQVSERQKRRCIRVMTLQDRTERNLPWTRSKLPTSETHEAAVSRGLALQGSMAFPSSS